MDRQKRSPAARPARRWLWAAAFLAALAALLAAAAAWGAEETPKPPQVIDLGEAIELALTNHPQVLQGRSVVEQGKAVVSQQRAAYWPVIDSNASYTRVKRGYVGGVSGRAVVSLFNNYNAGFSGTQIIYDFGRTSNRVSAALGALESDRFGLVSVEGDVALNVKVAYFQVIQAQRLLKVAQASVARLEEHLRQAEGLHDVGLRPKIDVTRARVDLASGVADQVSQQGNVQVAKATLVNAIGVPQSLDYEVAEVPVAPIPPELDPLVQEALDRRPEVKQILATLKGLEAQVSAAWADYLPSLTGNGDYFYAGDRFPLTNNWDIGASVNVPIFNGFFTQAQVNQAKAAVRQNQASLEGLRHDVRLEVERNYFDVKTALKRLDAQRVAVREAQENLELAKARYQQGLGSAIEYTDAEVSLTTAQANEVQALYDLQISQANLERAVGGPGMLAAPTGEM